MLMKKLFVLLAVMAATFTAHAEDYSYLTFVTTDGAKVSVALSSISIAIAGTTLTAGSQSFALSNLSSMYFSNADETTAIRTLTASEWDEVTEIYDLQGRKVSKDQMRSGQVYVVKSKRGTYKIAVK